MIWTKKNDYIEEFENDKIYKDIIVNGKIEKVLISDYYKSLSSLQEKLPFEIDKFKQDLSNDLVSEITKMQNLNNIAGVDKIDPDKEQIAKILQYVEELKKEKGDN